MLGILFIVTVLVLCCACGKKEQARQEGAVSEAGETSAENEDVPATGIADSAAEQGDSSAPESAAEEKEEPDATVSAEEPDEAVSTGEPEPRHRGLIMLDPGHSSVISEETEPNGPGSAEMKAADTIGTRGVTSGVMEYELTLDIAVQLKDELEKRGFEVLMTREDSSEPHSCTERAAAANEARADVFLRIHADGSTDPSSRGAMAVCITKGNPYESEWYEASRELSEAVLEKYCEATGLCSRGIWETDTMTGNNWAEMPTTLIELGFMTNSGEDLLMEDPDFQAKMVKGLADGLESYFGAKTSPQGSIRK